MSRSFLAPLLPHGIRGHAAGRSGAALGHHHHALCHSWRRSQDALAERHDRCRGAQPGRRHGPEPRCRQSLLLRRRCRGTHSYRNRPRRAPWCVANGMCALPRASVRRRSTCPTQSAPMPAWPHCACGVPDLKSASPQSCPDAGAARRHGSGAGSARHIPRESRSPASTSSSPPRTRVARMDTSCPTSRGSRSSLRRRC